MAYKRYKLDDLNCTFTTIVIIRITGNSKKSALMSRIQMDAER